MMEILARRRTKPHKKNTIANTLPFTLSLSPSPRPRYYFQLQTALATLIDSYAVAIDNVQKNYEKLRAPKGDAGSNSMSMF